MFYFELNEDKNSYTLSRYIGNDKEVIIPNTYQDKPVTTIGRWAFMYCDTFTNVAVPNSVKSIGDAAFYGCSGLTIVIIPNSVESIGEEAFQYCSSLKNVTISNSVTSIGKFAFFGCHGLKNVTIPNSVKSICNYAFSCCSKLTSVIIQSSVKSIGDNAFCGCTKLQKTHQKYYYKAFNADLTCRGFHYKEGEWFECEEAVLCVKGFHACKNAFDLFTYYSGELNKDIVIYEVELEDICDEREADSKVCAKRIRLVRKINYYAELLNKEE